MILKDRPRRAGAPRLNTIYIVAGLIIDNAKNQNGESKGGQFCRAGGGKVENDEFSCQRQLGNQNDGFDLNDVAVAFEYFKYRVFEFQPRQKNSWVVFGTGNAPSA